MKTQSKAFAILAGLGGALLIAMMLWSGIDYALQERQGLAPGPTPTGILIGMYIGFSVCVVGIVGFLVTQFIKK
ncbi:hypothetical protein [Timonella sp. A28]|uniref:hypothetical protein n=1 Tax=Timonella sp. A28 TaxID=3442640 RepID=UPI003EC1420F